MYYVLLAPGVSRESVLNGLNREGVNAVFHYVPLHSSPAGQELGRSSGELENTVELSSRLVRLPLWVGMTQGDIERVAEALQNSL